MKNEVPEIAELLQKNCHQNVQYAIEHSTQDISYQDAYNAWLINQLAVLQKQINDIKLKFPQLQY